MRVTGRATQAEERAMWNADNDALGLTLIKRAKRVPKLSQPTAPSLADAMRDSVRNQFTREHERTDFYRPSPPTAKTPKAHNGNIKKRNWPAMDEARNANLVVGANESETVILNNAAMWMMFELRRLTELAGPVPEYQKHNQTGYSEGYGSDSISDIGPTPEKLISLWIGSTPQLPQSRKRQAKIFKLMPKVSSKAILAAWKRRTAATVNEPWPVGDAEFMTVKAVTKRLTVQGEYTGDEEPVETLYTVGDLKFDPNGALTEYAKGKTDKNKQKIWLKFLDRLRQTKGGPLLEGEPQTVTSVFNIGTCLDDDDITDDVSQLLLPVSPFDSSSDYERPSVDRVRPLDGTMAFDGEELDDDESSDADGHLQSSWDPFVSDTVNRNARECAQEQLDHYKRILTRLPFEAFVDAAMGMRLCEIGGGPTRDKRAIARAKALLTTAIFAHLEHEAPIPQPLAA